MTKIDLLFLTISNRIYGPLRDGNIETRRKTKERKEKGHLDDKLPLAPVHHAAFGVDDDGARVRDAHQDAPLGGVVEPGHADGAASRVRPVQIAAHPVDGQTLARVQSVFQKHLALAAVDLLPLDRQPGVCQSFYGTASATDLQAPRIKTKDSKLFQHLLELDRRPGVSIIFAHGTGSRADLEAPRVKETLSKLFQHVQARGLRGISRVVVANSERERGRVRFQGRKTDGPHGNGDRKPNRGLRVIPRGEHSIPFEAEADGAQEKDSRPTQGLRAIPRGKTDGPHGNGDRGSKRGLRATPRGQPSIPSEVSKC